MAANDDQRESLTGLLEQCALVADRFSDLQRIPSSSNGHFSALLSAHDALTDRRVALKFLLPKYSGGYRDESFEREAVVLSELGAQPDIIQLVAPRQDFVLHLRTEQGFPFQLNFPFYALELARTDLGTVIANEEWSHEQLLVAFRAMCRGVQRLHARRTAHRDLTPTNFLVMQDGTIRLSDFGTARRFDGVTGNLGTYSGPPGKLSYAAPELLACLHEDTPEIALEADFFAHRTAPRSPQRSSGPSRAPTRRLPSAG